MFWFQLVVVIALIAGVGWVAMGAGGHMSEPEPDRPDLALPAQGLLERPDVDRVRFSVGARGYRMDEVDDVLDRLGYEIEVRERRIAELEGRPYEGPSADPASGAPFAEGGVGGQRGVGDEGSVGDEGFGGEGAEAVPGAPGGNGAEPPAAD